MSSNAIIECNNISFWYRPQEVLFKDFSWRIANGESRSIMGTSGCGKTTLLYLAGALLKPQQGEIKILGEPVPWEQEQRLAEIRNRVISYVFQYHELLPQYSVLENVLLPLRARGSLTAKDKERARELIDWVGLANKENQFPAHLSGGECQRVAIVRALIPQPQIIFLDEPTGNLDKNNTELILELLARLKKKIACSLVLISHDEQVASSMDQVWLLDRGRLYSRK